MKATGAVPALASPASSTLQHHRRLTQGVLKEGLAKKANKSKGQKRATVYTGA